MPRHSAVFSRASSTTIRPPPATYGGEPLRRVFTDATASDATAHDLDGAGRVVGNLISRGGRYLEPLFTKLSLVLGGGPRWPLEILLKSLRCTQCSKPYFGSKLSLPPRDASSDEVLRALFIYSRSCTRCGASQGFHALSDKKTSKVGKRFTRLLRGSNISSQYNALLYIAALSSLVPDLPAVLIKHNTTQAVAILAYRIAHQPNSNLDFLLAPSHRALVVLGQLEIHSTSKEILALNARVPTANTWDSFKDLTRQRTQLYELLSPSFDSPEMNISTAVLISAGIGGEQTDFASLIIEKWLPNTFYDEKWIDESPVYFDVLAQRLAHSGDPVLKSMLPAFLLAIRDCIIGWLRFQIQYRMGKGRAIRKPLHTLGILQSPDWERLLRSWFGLIGRDDEFMQYARQEYWHDFYKGDEDTDSSFEEEATDNEDEEMIPASFSKTQLDDNGFVSATALGGSSEENNVGDDYVSALSVFWDDTADVDGGEIV